MRHKIIRKRYLVLLALLVFIMVTSAAFFYYNYQAEEILNERKDEIKTIAELKSREINNWIKERTSDINVFSESTLFNDVVSDYIYYPSERSAKLIENQLELIKSNYDYDELFITNVEEEIKIILKTGTDDTLNIPVETIRKSISNSKVEFSDFYICPLRGGIHLDFTAPLMNRNNEVTAVIVFRIDPNRYLYPLISSWPNTNRKGETFILRKEGDYALFLNELLYKKNTALKLKVPITESQYPSVQAILGYQGIWEGVDYLGETVLSYIKDIEGTSWYLVAKLDKSTIFEELNYRAILISIIGLLITSFALMGLAYFYISKQKDLLYEISRVDKELLAAQSKFKTILYSIGDAVITTDEKGIVQQINSAAEKITGWTEADAEGIGLELIFHLENAKTGDRIDSSVDEILVGKVTSTLTEEAILVSTKGKRIPVSESKSPIKDENGDIIGVVFVLRDQTENYLKQKALEESEEKFRKIFEDSPLGKSMTTLDGKINVNNAFCKMLGYTESELADLHWKEITHPDDHNKSEKITQELFNEQIETATYEKRYLHKSGNIVWANVTTSIHKDSNGNKLFFLTTVQNITERIEAQQKILEEKKFTESVINAMPGIFYLADQAGNLIKWNNKLEELSGLSENEIQGVKLFDLIAPHDREKMTQAFKQAFNSGEVIVEAEFASRIKNHIPFYFNGIKILKDDKPVLLVIGIDISERLFAEKRYRSLFDNSPVAIWEEDWKGVIEYLDHLRNNGTTNLLEYFEKNNMTVSDALQNLEVIDVNSKTLKIFEAEKHEDIVELLQKNICSDESIQIYAEELKAFIDGKETYETVMNLKTLTGRRINVIMQVNFSSFKTNTNQVIVSILDITEITEMQRKLEHTLEDLKRSNKDLEQFAYVASHDLQEPLRMVSSYVQLIERRYKSMLDSDGIEFINFAVDGAKRMQILINDLLQYSRVSTRGSHFELTNLNDVINKVLLNLSSKIEETKAKINFEKLPDLRVDEVQITRVFQNLISNSLKYKSDNAPVIDLFSIDKGDEIQFSVSDNGIGISEEFNEKIFEIFVRLHTRSEFDGSGMGLAICKRIVEKHGGRIWVESNDKGGSTFNFTINKNLTEI